MRPLLFLLFIANVWALSEAENRPNAAIDKRFRLTNFAKLKRVLRRAGPRVESYALPRPPLAGNDEDHSGEQVLRTTASHERHRHGLPIHKMIPTNGRSEKVKSGRTYGASHRKNVAVTRTTTTIPSTIALQQRNATRAAWSPVPYIIASSSGESKQTPQGISRLAARNDVVEKMHSGFHTQSAGTTAFRRKILRMIVEQSLARKSNHSSQIKPEVVHVSGVYTDPNDRVGSPTVSAEQRRKLLPGYPRPSSHAHSHENRLVVDVPRSRESSRGSEEAFEPVFQVQPATRIHEDSNESLTTPQSTTLRRVEIKRPTTVIIHRKPPHAPPVFLRPTETPVQTTEQPEEEEEEEYTEFTPSSTDSNAIEEDEEEVTLSPYARSKLLRYAHRQRKRRVRQDDSIPSKFLQESLACRYCYVYWKRQDIQPRDIFTFCCRSKYRLV